MLRKMFTRKRNVVVLTAIAAFAVAGAAFAYFTSASTSSGTASVGSTSANSSWSESITSDSAASLYPAPAPVGGVTSGPIASLPFSLKNTTSGQLGLENLTVAVAQDSSGNIEAGSSLTSVSGCKASWFSVDGTGSPTDSSPWSHITMQNNGTTFTSVPADVATGKSVTGTATLQLIDTPTANQDACQGKVPVVNISTTNSGGSSSSF